MSAKNSLLKMPSLNRCTLANALLERNGETRVLTKEQFLPSFFVQCRNGIFTTILTNRVVGCGQGMTQLFISSGLPNWFPIQQWKEGIKRLGSTDFSLPNISVVIFTDEKLLRICGICGRQFTPSSYSLRYIKIYPRYTRPYHIKNHHV